jgi:hypothetical protein
MPRVGHRLFALFGECEDARRQVAAHREPAMLFVRFPSSSHAK